MTFFTKKILIYNASLPQQPLKNIVFISGLLSNANIWQNQQKFLSKIDITPSYANTHVNKDSTIKSIANKILQDLNHHEFILVAHSMGCYSAIKMAHLAPERVKGLILINGTANEPLMIEKNKKVDIIKKLSPCSEDKFSRIVSRNFFANQTFQRLTLDQELLLIKMAQQTGPVAFCNQLQLTINRGDLVPDFQQIKQSTPITIISSTNDKIIPNNGWSQVSQNNRSRIIETSEAGHLIPLEKPDMVNEEINKMLFNLHSTSEYQSEALFPSSS